MSTTYFYSSTTYFYSSTTYFYSSTTYFYSSATYPYHTITYVQRAIILTCPTITYVQRATSYLSYQRLLTRQPSRGTVIGYLKTGKFKELLKF
jgi:hypothetical protein